MSAQNWDKFLRVRAAAKQKHQWNIRNNPDYVRAVRIAAAKTKTTVFRRNALIKKQNDEKIEAQKRILRIQRARQLSFDFQKKMRDEEINEMYEQRRQYKNFYKESNEVNGKKEWIRRTGFLPYFAVTDLELPNDEGEHWNKEIKDIISEMYINYSRYGNGWLRRSAFEENHKEIDKRLDKAIDDMNEKDRAYYKTMWPYMKENNIKIEPFNNYKRKTFYL